MRDGTTASAPDLLHTLRRVGEVWGAAAMARKLGALQDWIADDLSDVEAELDGLSHQGGLAQRGARHLLDLRGKRLRPTCVALAARVGSGFGPSARDLAVAVELIHNATLLHDDVIDLGDRRRGAPTARVIYGNTASVLAGDWLLVAALTRIRAARQSGLLDRALATLEDMITAEALQLEYRGRVPDHSVYFRVVEGKTASLFGWGLFAGGRAGGLSEPACEALESYGAHLGVAFQLVDDLLDFSGDAAVTGKAVSRDLFEGKVTYPLLLALEREPGLLSELETVLERPCETSTRAVSARVRASLDRTGALHDGLALARDRTRAAIDCLGCVPAGPGRQALITVAESMIHRRR